MFSNLKRLYIKLASFCFRAGRAVWWWPVRFFRLGAHFFGGVGVFFQKNKRADIRQWWEDLVFLLFDLVAVPEIYETLMDFAKWQTRPLSPTEKQLARSVFGDTIRLERVRVDESAQVVCKRSHVIYVSYYTINAWGRFRPDILVHELMHVWQFERLGGAYIPGALRAQKLKEGYNYGGVEVLAACMARGGGLSDFNLEQQADIISDYFCIREGMKPAWGQGSRQDLAVYEYFIADLKQRNSFFKPRGLP